MRSARVLCVAVVAIPAIGQPRLTPLLITRDPGPGRTGQLLSINTIDVAAGGRLAVHVTALDPISGTGRDVFLVGRDGDLRVAAAGGDPAPGLAGGTTIGTFFGSSLNVGDSGHAAVGVDVVLDGQARRAAYAIEPDGALRLVTATGASVPGVPNAAWISLNSAAVTQAGDVWLTGNASAPGGDIGVLYSFRQGVIHRTGTSPVGLEGAAIVSLQTIRPQLAGTGFSAVWSLRRNNRTFDAAVLSSPLRRLLSADAPPPGLPSLTFDDITASAASSEGVAAYATVLAGPGIADTNSRALWLAGSTGARIVLRGGDTIPGSTARVFLFGNHVMDAVSETFIAVTLTGPGVTSLNDTALLRISPAGAVTVLCREGSSVPGEPSGVHFGHISFAPGPASWDGFANERGLFLASCNLAGPSVPAGSERAIVMWDEVRGPQVLMRVGRLITVGGVSTAVTEVRTATWVAPLPRVTGGADGMPSVFTELGRAYVALRFTLAGRDRWGLFRIDPQAGPCGADFNNDGSVDFLDLSDFIETSDGGSSIADFNGDGFVDFFDFDDFVAAFELGC
jgi:hypothetical protein